LLKVKDLKRLQYVDPADVHAVTQPYPVFTATSRWHHA
jgi:hypothetical protein